MTTFFTSDTHFGHARIIELCDRPFRDVDHMNAEIVRRWNEVVSPDDIVFHLGDVALGTIASSLPQVGNLNGYIILVLGNHDRPFMERRKPAKHQHWLDEYGKYFDEIRTHTYRDFDNRTVALSHFPYDGDSHGEDRYAEDRLPDVGAPLIHGHTHSSGSPVSFSAGRNTLQIHVGMDAWSFTPVHESQVADLIRANV